MAQLICCQTGITIQVFMEDATSLFKNLTVFIRKWCVESSGHLPLKTVAHTQPSRAVH